MSALHHLMQTRHACTACFICDVHVSVAVLKPHWQLQQQLLGASHMAVYMKAV